VEEDAEDEAAEGATDDVAVTAATLGNTERREEDDFDVGPGVRGTFTAACCCWKARKSGGGWEYVDATVDATVAAVFDAPPRYERRGLDWDLGSALAGSSSRAAICEPSVGHSSGWDHCDADRGQVKKRSSRIHNGNAGRPRVGLTS
jgi:hypothetical protein